MGLCEFTQPSVLCMLGHRSGPAHQFRKNQFGRCGTDIYTNRYTYIYNIYIYMCDLDYTLDVWCFPGSLPIEGSVAGKGGVTHIAAHSSPTGLREVALPETVLYTGGVMFSYRYSRDRKYLSQILIGLRGAIGG